MVCTCADTVGPVFFSEAVTSNSYFELVQGIFMPHLENSGMDLQTFFQQDSC